ncbi:MAG: phage tail protein [Candidatus Sedimenticola sp. (ex Thyasira tokunagai)]
MLTLGNFIFELRTTPFQQLRRSDSQRWGSQNRLGLRPALQDLGPGDETLSLSGVLHPEITGGRVHLDKLRDMMHSGSAWVLIDGGGYVYGLWVIKNIDETSTLFFKDGAARRIEFSLNLTRVDDDRVDLLGDQA